MIFKLDEKNPNAIAAIDEEGKIITYGELISFSEGYREWISKKTLVFVLCKNTQEALKVYVASLCNEVVPLLLDGGLDQELLENLIKTYEPEFLWLPKERLDAFDYDVHAEVDDYVLVKTGYTNNDLFKDLALLLTTSGSTGTAKLVRQSYTNIMANAEAIVEYLEITEKERPITNLPMSYTYGLSVINSHLLAGATILLTDRSIFQKEFWAFFKEKEATSMAGVPYTYEMLKKLRFFRMELPSLRTLTQAGGKLSPELHKEFAEYSRDHGIRFFVMYGQTEATARMSYLPWEKSIEKYGSMGVAIPGGKFSLIDAEGNEINDPEITGELVYEGPNVTLGYAESKEDLALGDERFGKLITGDMAKKDADGFYYIVGRKKRFLKIFGKRVNLDECERMVKQEFEIECACAGRDDLLYIYVLDESLKKPACQFLSSKMNLHHTAFKAVVLESIPKNEAGKIQYKELPL